MKFFMIATSHLVTKLWFEDDADFAAAMNFVAIAAYTLGINVLSFVLMSNHVHFVLECDYDQAVKFISFFKERYSLYRRKRYGDKEFLRGNKIDIQEITLENESMERAIAYVQCNPVAARLCVHPTGYPWGSGNVFFNPSRPLGRSAGSFSRRSLTKLLHSRLKVHPDWIVGEKGYILPQSYVPVFFVEGLYRTSTRYQYFLDSSSKAKKTKEQVAPSFSDQLVLTASLNLCRSLFRSNSVDELSPMQTGELVRQLRRRFSSDVTQICRVTGIQYAEAVNYLESF